MLASTVIPLLYFVAVTIIKSDSIIILFDLNLMFCFNRVKMLYEGLVRVVTFNIQ